MKFRVRGCLLVGLLITTSVAVADTRFDFRLGVRGVFTDNFYYQEGTNTDNLSAIIRSDIGIDRQDSTVTSFLKLNAQGAASTYGRSDNYLDYGANTGIGFKFGLNTLGLKVAFKENHDAFGTERTEGDGSQDRELDIWNQHNATLNWQRNGEAIGSIFSDVSARYWKRDYITNEDQTRFLERNGYNGDALLGVNVGSKVGIFVRGIYSTVEFDVDTIGEIRSGTTRAGLVGLRWQATARTSGSVQFGLSEREPDSAGSTFESEYWALEFDWKASKNTTLSLNSSRSYVESYTVEARFFDTTNVGLQWHQKWSHRLNSDVITGWQNRDFNPTDREDNTYLASMRLTYALDQAFSAFYHMRYRERDSNRIDRSFERTLAMIGFEVRLN